MLGGSQAEAATAAQRADAAAEAALGTAKDLERQKRAAERKLVGSPFGRLHPYLHADLRPSRCYDTVDA